MAFTEFAADDSLVKDYEAAAKEIYPLLKGARTDFLIGQYATAFANILGNPGEFFQYVTGSHGDRQAKTDQLLESFSANLSLLVTKTWCSPETDKDRKKVISGSESFLKAFRAGKLSQARTAFTELVGRLNALIFGEVAGTAEFLEWAFRIDPKLGLFAWFVNQLAGDESIGSEDLLRTELLMGVYFLSTL